MSLTWPLHPLPSDRQGWALVLGGAGRIAVLDFGVHQGNGTESIFADK